MRVLVIGGTRFIGRAIVDRLLREGHAVTLLNRGRTPDPFGTRVRRVVGDRRETAVLERAFRRTDFDVVVDVIAYHERDTEALVQAARGGVGHLIHISTASVYLIRDGILPPFSEEQFAGRLVPRAPGTESAWLYAYHKRRCEEVLSRAWADERFPATSLRLPMVVGPHDYTRRAEAYLERLATGGPLLLPDAGLNSWGFLWVEDVAEVVTANLANESTFGRAYNLAQREALNLRQFLELAAAALEVSPRLIPVPSDWLRQIGLGTGFSPFSHDHDILLDCRAADEDLLFRPTPPSRWIPELVRHFTASWNGSLTAHAATRAQELELARHLAGVRLPVLRPASVR